MNSLVSFADNLLIDDFLEYLKQEVKDNNYCREKYKKSVKTCDDAHQYYFLLGLEEESKIILDKYEQYRINQLRKLMVE